MLDGQHDANERGMLVFVGGLTFNVQIRGREIQAAEQHGPVQIEPIGKIHVAERVVVEAGVAFASHPVIKRQDPQNVRERVGVALGQRIVGLCSMRILGRWRLFVLPCLPPFRLISRATVLVRYPVISRWLTRLQVWSLAGQAWPGGNGASSPVTRLVRGRKTRELYARNQSVIGTGRLCWNVPRNRPAPLLSNRLTTRGASCRNHSPVSDLAPHSGIGRFSMPEAFGANQ